MILPVLQSQQVTVMFCFSHNSYYPQKANTRSKFTYHTNFSCKRFSFQLKRTKRSKRKPFIFYGIITYLRNLWWFPCWFEFFMKDNPEGIV